MDLKTWVNVNFARVDVNFKWSLQPNFATDFFHFDIIEH